MITLVIPVYNEMTRWDEQYFSKIAELADLQLLFVNDGSTDKSSDLISKLVEIHSNVSLVNLEVNVGKAEAVRRGMSLGMSLPNTHIIGYLDSDGAFSFQDIQAVIESVTGSKSGERATWWWTSRRRSVNTRIERSFLRHLIGRSVSAILSWRDATLPYDTQSGFKLFVVDEVLEMVTSKPFITRWFVDLEIFYRYKILTLSEPHILEVQLCDWKEVPNSKLGIRQSFVVINELFNIKKLQKGKLI